jgi:hypothetical protein
LSGGRYGATADLLSYREIFIDECRLEVQSQWMVAIVLFSLCFHFVK